MSKSERNLGNPLYAAVGAGDLALKQVNEVINQLRERTEAAAGSAQARIEETRGRIGETRSRIESLPEEVPANIEELRSRFTPEELRKVAEAYIEVATDIYNSLAERGEETVERLRQQPAVQEQLSRAEKAYNDAVDLTEDALGTVSSQTRAVGERAAKIASIAGSKADEAASTASAKIADAADTAAAKTQGAAGTVEGKARTSADSPAKKLEEAATPAKKAPAKKTAPAKKAPAKKAPAKKATRPAK
ncbi:heparin-binding hemagglutinin [Williamsia sterculiae]|uniref:Heparin binding hemagglutinin HbhA n=1 Tax=Williamsia sterculiae TaxID=1344003 RepID=A0A1N7EXI0_9NOCA|nr:heparin-binding hemagglutinin [Williamsia sterculiae]SIR92766.1 heparin binding hemagglutinin HbhA [Williamsia sterculiae]